ncbi:maleylpyruvate isomerase N-terminal domain-containing protein [Streptomyces werraensis]|uniref:maleylpyruvate isomerase N-terminal domain-containing protein n=2 Tax=Streptomyces werraensis TaxID=68284 RepID=UPI00341371F2
MSHEHVDAAVTAMLRVLGPPTADDWTVPAGTLGWTCRQTAAHIGHDLPAYAGQLAARARPTDAYLLPVDLTVRPSRFAGRGALQSVTACGGLLSSAPATAGPDARAWHRGSCDPTDFAAMGVAETLPHTYDITQGLSVDRLPPAELSGAVLDRLFPAAPPGDPARVLLLWCTGRGDLDGLPRRTSWVWEAALPD